MKKILGLDLGTNSIGWALIENEFENKVGSIIGSGVRIIPMSQDVLGKFDSGTTISQTAERTHYRSVRRLIERSKLRRERLLRVLNSLDWLPNHFKEQIDFDKNLGQYKNHNEPKIAWVSGSRKNEFYYKSAFNEMLEDFKSHKSTLVDNGKKIPYDWTIYFLRKKALKEKVTKEELAWVLLNFNQKRGYYQLRGEEEETDGKLVEYHQLKVIDVIDSGEKNKSGIVYTIKLENEWEFNKPSKNPVNWKDQVKEFIVTTPVEEDGLTPKKTKEGDVKRTFRTVDSEKDWIAIKKKTENDLESSNKTVGEYIYDTILSNPSQKIRGKLIRTIERKYYKKELSRILRKQAEFHSEFTEKEILKKCVNELYPNNDAHRNERLTQSLQDFIIQDIIFYQRPLKSKTSLISDCPFEYSWIEKDNQKVKKFKKCIPKSNPLYQEFRLWQFISNLRIYKREAKINDKTEIDIDITNDVLNGIENYENLFDWLNNQTSITQKKLLKFLIPNEKNPERDYRWNYVEDKEYPANETRGEFIKKIKGINGLDNSLFNDFFTNDLWHILYSILDKKELEKALKKFVKRHNLPGEFIKEFKKFPPYKRDYGAYSAKAIKKILPLMRLGKYWSWDNIDENTKDRIDKILTGEFDEKIRTRVREKSIHLQNKQDFTALPVWLSTYIIYDRHSEAKEITQWHSPDDIRNFLHNHFKQHSLRNPIVEQVVTETLRVVEDIWKKYGNGKANFFDEIHIELGRNIKNSAEKRKQINNRVLENQNTNHRIKLILEELKNEGIEAVRPFSPSHQEILKIYEDGIYKSKNEIDDDIIKIRRNSAPSKKEIEKYKLWLGQGYISPYTGRPIQLTELFTTKYQIEHIIPQSRFFNDSLSNKIICEAEVNELKGNKTAYEFIKENPGRKVELNHGKTIQLFSLYEYENHVKSFFKNDSKKKEFLLSEDIPDSFIERQLNDSRYISKYVRTLLSNIVRNKDEEEPVSKNIVTLAGSITDVMKQHWGLNDVWNKLITPRFERLNELTNSNQFGFWDNKDGKRVFQITLPKEIEKGFSKKRIDHRHHALDAIVVASVTREHVNYITSLNTKRENHAFVRKLREVEEKNIQKRDFNGENKIKRITRYGNYHKPWDEFNQDVALSLEKIVVSFKQNLRVINKATNKYEKWIERDGKKVKTICQQTKGENWAIRKPMHEETVSGIIDLPWVKVGKDEIITATRERNDLVSIFKDVKTKDKAVKKISKITDKGIQKILINFLKNKFNDPELAFSPEGIEELNENITHYNEGKFHQPIFKVRTYEKGKGRFVLGSKGNKKSKYVQGAPNLFYAVYWDENKELRVFETIPLNIVIERLKQGLGPVPQTNGQGEKLLFHLSPDDLVYIPTEDEKVNREGIDFHNLTEEQLRRIFFVNDFSGSTCYFRPNRIAKAIIEKEVDLSLNVKKNKLTGSFDIKTASFNYEQIKNSCIKLKVNRLGEISKAL